MLIYFALKVIYTMHHILAIINHRSTFIFVAVNAMRQGFFSIVLPLRLITQAFISKVQAQNSESRAFISEVHAQNSKSLALQERHYELFNLAPTLA
ncbi:MAG: hypothetical protein RMZ43_014855 [Nostoc sp. CmiVER01]|uniref:hypothetical protein n=1 Tax=Nostoc sp. CmiVER01 TaxID=3075384 RepID=UPI002AD501EC|nr:hypothetical protein [Nostoc sp. CmiVER01]MDZ8122635.1 hypothetical protein [Nostoc sp. CmiVER01]